LNLSVFIKTSKCRWSISVEMLVHALFMQHLLNWIAGTIFYQV